MKAQVFTESSLPLHEVLGQMNQIGKILTRFDSLEKNFSEILAIAAKVVPMRSAVIIENRESGALKATVWHAPDTKKERLSAALQHSQEAFSFLKKTLPEPSHQLQGDQIIQLVETEVLEAKEDKARQNYIVLPLVVNHHPLFGVLQVEEGTIPLGETSLAFFNALANQLAIALDRSHMLKLQQEMMIREQENLRLLEKQQQLAKSELQFRNFANQLPQLSWMINPEGRHFWFNERWFDYTGTTADDMESKGWNMFLHPEHLDRVVENLNQAIAAGQSWEDTFPLKGKDGLWRWFLSRAVPIKNDQEEILWWLGTDTDITELRQAKDAAAHLAAIVTSSDSAIASSTLDGLISTWNTAAEHMFGYTYKEVIGKSTKILLPPDRLDEESAILKTILSGDFVQHAETFRIRKDGSQLPISLSISPIKDEAGKIVGIAKIARDITQQKQAEKELREARVAAEQANQAKGQFLANMSHEIRTPLGAILGFAELLSEPNTSVSDQRIFLNTIIKNGQTLSRLIDDILDLSKVEAGKIEVEHLPIVIFSLLSEVIEMFRPKLAEKGLTIRILEAQDAPKAIVSDVTRLQQILVNIIGNAIKFSKDGEILISIAKESARQQRELLVVSIKDQGPGLTPQQQQSIFQPFVQGDASTTRQHGGTGLGLVISRRLARLLGGDLTIGACDYGQGCTFIIKVATGLVAGQVLETKKDSELNPNRIQQFPKTLKDELRGIRVLVADDAPDNRALIYRTLTAQGATVEFAEDGQVAIDKAISHASDYDLVLMDIQMPQLDGLEATRWLRSHGYKRPIIALSAHAMQTEQERSYSAGCDGHLVKPISPRELVSKVVFYLDQRKLH